MYDAEKTRLMMSGVDLTVELDLVADEAALLAEFLVKSVPGFHSGVSFAVLGRTVSHRTVFLGKGAVQRLVQAVLAQQLVSDPSPGDAISDKGEPDELA